MGHGRQMPSQLADTVVSGGTVLPKLWRGLLQLLTVARVHEMLVLLRLGYEILKFDGDFGLVVGLSVGAGH